MGVQALVTWYQKKIGTYDKQHWEKTVEQHILHGLTNVPKKRAKLKPDLIDVDLVRGSSFPKAKPKHGLLTVTKLALIRWIFLPVHSRWWIQQTSFRSYIIILVLYILQLTNIVIYFYFSSHDDSDFEHVSPYEVLVPSAMMLILSIIHSQIVSTSTTSTGELRKEKRKHSRRIKRRELRNFPFDSKKDEKECLSSYRYGKTAKRGNEEVRRRFVAWGNPLLETTCGASQYVTDPNPIIKLPRRVGEPVIEDDGFESLNSNGSSENGDEVKTNFDILENKKLKNDFIIPNESQERRGKKISFIFDDNDCGNIEFIKNKNKKIEESLKKDKDKLFCFENAHKLSIEMDLMTNRSFKPDLIPQPLKHKSWLEESSVSLENGCREDWTHSVNSSIRRQSAPGSCISCETCDHDTDHKDTDSDGSNSNLRVKKSTSPQRLIHRRRGSKTLQVNLSPSSCNNSSCESDDADHAQQFTEGGTTSAAEWIGITTNSEECSVSSEIDEESEGPGKVMEDHPFAWEFQMSPNTIMSPSCAASDKVSCTMWESRDVKRAELSVLDISSAIIARVETMPENMDYFYAGVMVSIILSLVPPLCRLFEAANDTSSENSSQLNIDPILSLAAADLSESLLQYIINNLSVIIDVMFGNTLLERIVVIISMIERCLLAILFFFIIAVAERTFKQRFLYAKLFSHLTSFRRAKKSDLPHFRLNKVRNIKTWLSIRSYLKKRGPQRSVDVIVSASFIITLLLLSFLSVELLKDSVRLHSEYNVEALIWCLVLGIYLLRFMTLGNKTNRKYRNLSVLLTEQINLYLQIEQKPHKKEELMVANSVLKLAADLLKELESPFKISGLSANPYVYTITKVVILSALSGVLSEMLGFKLKLHKIKIK